MRFIKSIHQKYLSIHYITLQTYTLTHPFMKKYPYLPNQHRKLNQFLADLSQHELDNTNRQLKELLNKKKAKLREIYSLSSHQVVQPKMIPTKMSHGEFMDITPMAVGQAFIDQKIKANILKPDRFYSSQPNVKAGSFILPKRCSVVEDRRVTNNSFEQYSRIVDETSGQAKHKKLLTLLTLHEQTGKPKYTRMKKTLFQRFMPDKYNFYNNPLSLKKSTTFQSNTLKRSQSKYLKSQEESLILQQQYDQQNIPSSVKQIRTIEISQQVNPRSIRRSSIMEKSRLKTNFQKEIGQKNINSLQQ